MSHTVIGIFTYTSEAQQAKEYLLSNGFSNDQIDINTGNASDMSNDTEDRSTTSSNTENSSHEESIGDKISNFFSNLFSDDEDEHDKNKYTDAARRGTTVTVHANSSAEAESASQILDNLGAVDVNEFEGSESNRFNQSSAGTTGMMDTTNSMGTNTNTEMNSDLDTTRSMQTGENKTIPVIKEDLQVGKQEIETGGVRLRSKIVERPVEEHLRLREEHVNVERTPVNRPATEADFNNFKEGTVEMREHAERPVVNKDARVVEEVGLNKEVTEREETIRDKVRNTEVNTDNITGSTENTNNLNRNENLSRTDEDMDQDSDLLLP